MAHPSRQQQRGARVPARAGQGARQAVGMPSRAGSARAVPAGRVGQGLRPGTPAPAYVERQLPSQGFLGDLWTVMTSLLPRVSLATRRGQVPGGQAMALQLVIHFPDVPGMLRRMVQAARPPVLEPIVQGGVPGGGTGSAQVPVAAPVRALPATTAAPGNARPMLPVAAGPQMPGNARPAGAGVVRPGQVPPRGPHAGGIPSTAIGAGAPGMSPSRGMPPMTLARLQASASRIPPAMGAGSQAGSATPPAPSHAATPTGTSAPASPVGVRESAAAPATTSANTGLRAAIARL